MVASSGSNVLLYNTKMKLVDNLYPTAIIDLIGHVFIRPTLRDIVLHVLF